MAGLYNRPQQLETWPEQVIFTPEALNNFAELGRAAGKDPPPDFLPPGEEFNSLKEELRPAKLRSGTTLIAVTITRMTPGDQLEPIPRHTN